MAFVIQPGQEIGRCRIERELGRGGMGAVYLATHVALDIPVAIKILLPMQGPQWDLILQRFLREARLAARIRHPNVVGVMDVGEDPVHKLHYIVMEYVDGESLSETLKRGPLPIEKALSVVSDVTEVLVEAAKHNIVHRDIKPDNIMFTKDGRTKLADLGIAKHVDVDRETMLTSEGSLVGTPAFMSPEQARNARDVDARADIYSLGATFYCMLTGEPPFTGQTAVEVLTHLLYDPVPDPRGLRPETPTIVAQLCMKMMAKEVEKRPRDASELLAVIQKIRANLKQSLANPLPQREAKGTAKVEKPSPKPQTPSTLEEKKVESKGVTLVAEETADLFALEGGEKEGDSIDLGPAEELRDDIEFECPIFVPLEELDNRFLGYVTADALGSRGPGRPPLIAANLVITEAILERIHENAFKLGPDGTELRAVRLKKKVKTAVPNVQEIVSIEKAQPVAQGFTATFDAIREQFLAQATNPEEIFKENEEEALKKIRKVKINLSPEFREAIEILIRNILQTHTFATLFACMGNISEAATDRAIQQFMVGVKLLCKQHHVTPENFARKKAVIGYALGIMFQDVGLMFLPKEFSERIYRFSKEELEDIEAMMRQKEIDPKYFATIQTVNDSRLAFRPYVEERLKREIRKMNFLVNAGVLTESQYQRLKTFPKNACLAPEEQEILEKHPIWSWELFRGSGFVSIHALDVLRYHHQRLDGSGYPPPAINMSIEAQIAAGVDVFDSIIADRPNNDPKGYDVAFRVIDAMTTGTGKISPKLSRRVYELFCACIQKYPVGSFIRIEGGPYDGCFGQIVYYTPYIMDRPAFLLLRDKRGRRIEKNLLFKKEHYDGTFRIVGLPFTKKINEIMLKP